MNGNIMLRQDNSLYRKYFAEDLTKAIKDSGNREFSEARKQWNRLGLKVTVTWEDMINAVVENLSEHLMEGLVQLTIVEITGEKECRDALREKKDQTIVLNLSRNLSPFKIYAEFIIKSGILELKKFRFDFEVEPNVEIEDINVIIQEKKLKSISFGSFKASLTLSLLKGEQAVNIVSIEKSLKMPDVHFEFKKERENWSAEAVQTDALMKAELILPKRKIEIEAGENTFGRSDFENDLSAADLGYISNKDGEKYHFRITKPAGVFYIQDDNSTNGTEVNGEEIKGKGRIELKDGDKITLAGINSFIIIFKISWE